MRGSSYLPPALRRLQLLLDLLQGRVSAWGDGGVEVVVPLEGGRPQDHLEGLTRGPLVQLDHLHVSDDAQVEVHHT